MLLRYIQSYIPSNYDYSRPHKKSISAGFYFHVSANEWLVLLLISALVLALETINSAIEKLCDLYTKETHPQIKRIKDIAAGAVLISAIFALVIAIVIFKKYIQILIS